MRRSCGLLRAARYALGLELLQALPLRPVVELDPEDQSRHHQHGNGIGCDDEAGVRTEVHSPLPGAACARISIKARTRRRRISLPIAATCSVMNSSVNANAITSSGIRMVG